MWMYRCRYCDKITADVSRDLRVCPNCYLRWSMAVDARLTLMEAGLSPEEAAQQVPMPDIPA